MRKPEITPAADWPIGSKITLLNAHMQNPITVRVTRHPNIDHLVCEDERTIVYYARTDRVVGFADGDGPIEDDLSDILG